MSEPDALPAGAFAAWIDATRRGRDDGTGVDVPCGECTACCRSSYFVHIAPEEAETLARIPGELLFPAPGLPDGHVLMGYDERGHCPMLVDDRCSIYEHRPRTCREFDCRVFAAAGVEPDDRDDIAKRVRRWEFALPTERDRTRQAAVRAAVGHLRKHPECFPGGTVPALPERLALAAVRVHHLFLDAADTDTSPEPTPAEVRAALAS